MIQKIKTVKHDGAIGQRIDDAGVMLRSTELKILNLRRTH